MGGSVEGEGEVAPPSSRPLFFVSVDAAAAADLETTKDADVLKTGEAADSDDAAAVADLESTADLESVSTFNGNRL